MFPFVLHVEYLAASSLRINHIAIHLDMTYNLSSKKLVRVIVAAQ